MWPVSVRQYARKVPPFHEPQHNMEQTWASVDLGSHTARLLIARRLGPSGPLIPLLRKREYIRLAQGLSPEGVIGPDLCERVLGVFRRFSYLLADFRVQQVRGAATGVFRKAVNAGQLLKLIEVETGIPIRIIPGEMEAMLSGRGALGAMDFKGEEFTVFDLGGGTTEFFYGSGEGEKARSLPFGAAGLTRSFIHADPPDETELNAVSREIDKRLEDERMELPSGGILIGTGGSVTTLAAMLHRVPREEITPERINGLELTHARVSRCLERMCRIRSQERTRLHGLDPERAHVIVAGTLVVMGIMGYVETSSLFASMSDLLEGLLMIGD